MIPSAILARYARSLTEVVFEENIEQKVTEDLQTYREIFKACPELLDAFHAPSIPRETKENILKEVMSRYPVHPIASNFLRILLQHNRIRYFDQIFESYLKLTNQRMGIVSAQVTAAVPLSEEESRKFAEKLVAITGKHVNVETHTDETLLGGVVVQMGNTIFDGSIRTQLSEMKRRLMES